MKNYRYFLNVDKLANDMDHAKVPNMTDTSIAVHLDDVGQEVVAKIIHQALVPVVRGLIADKNKPTCPVDKNSSR